jgi:predicted RNA-binding Zn-ribbon protein involved in translation (DUF1610 family)
MLKATKKEVLYVKQELVFDCPNCGMKYFISAVLGENEDLWKQQFVQYCPNCGAKYLENSSRSDVFA